MGLINIVRSIPSDQFDAPVTISDDGLSYNYVGNPYTADSAVVFRITPSEFTREPFTRIRIKCNMAGDIRTDIDPQALYASGDYDIEPAPNEMFGQQGYRPFLAAEAYDYVLGDPIFLSPIKEMSLDSPFDAIAPTSLTLDIPLSGMYYFWDTWDPDTEIQIIIVAQSPYLLHKTNPFSLSESIHDLNVMIWEIAIDAADLGTFWVNKNGVGEEYYTPEYFPVVGPGGDA